MMKAEFENLVGKTVSESEYEIIEKVYSWHPAISERDGKQQISELYKEFGMSVIRGMLEVADYMMELEKEEARLKRLISRINERRAYLAEGETTVEKAIETLEEAWIKAGSEKEFSNKKKEFEKKYGAEIVHIAVELGGIEDV